MSQLVPFYLTLPSDASISMYPQNNAAEWTTKLPQAISLPGKWEVGLSEFHYVNSLYAVRDGIDTLEVFVIESIHQMSEDEFSVKEVQHTVKVPPGTYKSAQALLDVVNTEIPPLNEYFYFYPIGKEKTATQFTDVGYKQNAPLLQLSLTQEKKDCPGKDSCHVSQHASSSGFPETFPLESYARF